MVAKQYIHSVGSSQTMSGDYSQHGVQSCVWAADSEAGAIKHLINATRHHIAIGNLNHIIHIFKFKSGSYQRALFRKQRQGYYCTSMGYKNAGSHIVPLFIDDNNKVDYEIKDISEYFKKKVALSHSLSMTITK